MCWLINSLYVLFKEPDFLWEVDFPTLSSVSTPSWVLLEKKKKIMGFSVRLPFHQVSLKYYVHI